MHRCRSIMVAAAAAGVLSAVPAEAADAPSVRLFLHSASRTYFDDAKAGAPYTAPPGSTATGTVPTSADSATAESSGIGGSAALPPGTPRTPTWSIPVTGAVRSVCLDLFMKSRAIAFTAPPELNRRIHINVRLSNSGATGTSVFEQTSQDPWPDGVARFTGSFTFDEWTAMPGAMLSLYGNANNNPDWLLHYDSTDHFSSVRFNLPTAKCVPEPSRPPKPKRA